MTTLHEYKPKSQMKLTDDGRQDRRQARRHDLETQGILVQRYDGQKRSGEVLGRVVDLSTSGVRIRTQHGPIRPDNQIRVRLALPSYAGICPFVDTGAKQPKPRNEWVGWMSVARVQRVDSQQMEVAGRLMDMDEMDRGMLGLYLSTQPLAA